MIEQQIEKLKTLQESYDAVATTIEVLLPAIADKIDNIDLIPLENKVDDGVSALSTKIDNIDLSAVENKVLEESAAIQAKIDNIKLPEIDTSALAKQGDNQDATNTAIYALLSQFGESVLQEAVTVICNCAEDIAWEEYGVVITYADGTSQSLPMSENGTCSFSVKIGQEYSVQLPVIGAYIDPTLKTYTASTSSRQIYWSYVFVGAFGVDELGRRYTLAQIESLEDRSIIKYVGFTNNVLENSTRGDGTYGNGFLLTFDTPISVQKYLSKNIELAQNLLPFTTNLNDAMIHCCGEDYTRYILAECMRLDVSSSAANWATSESIIVAGKTLNGFIPSYYQMICYLNNYSSINAIFNLCGYTANNKAPTNDWLTSNQYGSGTHAVYYAGILKGYSNTFGETVLRMFSLPK